MAVTVLLEIKTKPGGGDAMNAKLKEILPDTRAREGFISISVIRDQDDPDTLIAVEEWETRGHYEQYLAWRTEIGTLAELGEMFGAPPSIRYFDTTDA
jgi:quinol monooxygenase YgiN